MWELSDDPQARRSGTTFFNREPVTNLLRE
jgi:hypothetical protein